MAVVARLTWQAADPVGLAGSLAELLGVAAVPDRDRLAFPFGTTVLEVVAWRPEDDGDRPRPGGRLVLEPAWEAADASTVDPGPGSPLTLVGVAWGTVELDRAEAELATWLAGEAPTDGTADGTRDDALGAVTRTREAPELPGGRLVLAEPVTEGRVAASLARDGEGPCGLYLAPHASLGIAAWRAAARARGVRLGRRARGPFGTGSLVLGGPAPGPHLVVVDAAASVSTGGRPGTIRA